MKFRPIIKILKYRFRLKDFFSVPVLIILSLFAGKYINDYVYEHSQASRIDKLQTDIVKVVFLSDSKNDTIHAEFYKHYAELISRVQDVHLCIMTLQQEMLALRDSKEASEHINEKIVKSLLEKYDRVIIENCK